MTLLYWEWAKSWDFLEFDVCETLTSTFSSTATGSPIHEGFEVKDSVYLNPTIVSMSIIVSNHPAVNAFLMPSVLPARAIRALATMLELMESGTIVSLMTSDSIYDSFIIKSITRNRDIDIGDELVANVQLEKIQLASDIIFNSTDTANSTKKTVSPVSFLGVI